MKFRRLYAHDIQPIDLDDKHRRKDFEYRRDEIQGGRLVGRLIYDLIKGVGAHIVLSSTAPGLFYTSFFIFHFSIIMFGYGS